MSIFRCTRLPAGSQSERASSHSAMTFVFEGNFDLGAVGLDPTVVDNHVLVHDFRYAQLAQMFSCLFDHLPGGVFPALGATPDEFDNVISAFGINNLVGTLGHWGILLATCPAGPSHPTPKGHTAPACLALIGCPSVARFPPKMLTQKDENLRSAGEPKKQRRLMSADVRCPAR